LDQQLIAFSIALMRERNWRLRRVEESVARFGVVKRFMLQYALSHKEFKIAKA
jgi:hypothetical protein